MADELDVIATETRKTLADVSLSGASALVGTLSLAAAELANKHGRVDLLPGDIQRGVYAWAGFALLVLAFVISIPSQRRVGRLAFTNRRLHTELTEHKQRETAACRVSADLLQIKLEEIAESLGLQSSERVSFFLDAPDADGLVLAARFSKTQSYLTKGRKRYPYGEGCIGRAWDTGELAHCTIESSAARDLAAWVAETTAKAGIPHQTAQQLHMKSRTCIARRIPGPPGARPRGLIATESTSAATDDFVASRLPKHLDPQRLESYVLRNEAMIARLLELAADLRVAGSPDQQRLGQPSKKRFRKLRPSS
jgi:hypothetical protein